MTRNRGHRSWCARKVVLAGLLVLWTQWDATSTPVAAAEAPALSAAAAPQQVVRALVRSKAQAMLSSEIVGRIVRMPLFEGDRFRKGDRLVEFDCGTAQAVQAAADAALNHARAKLNSVESLAAMRSTGAVEVALARADADKARAEARSAALTVERCVVTAPFAGRVVELRARPFESVPAGAPLLSILDDASLEVSMVIPAAWLVWLQAGSSFILEVDETRTSYPGRMTRLGAQVDPVSQTVTVFGDLTGALNGLVSGMSGAARLAPAEKP